MVCSIPLFLGDFFRYVKVFNTNVLYCKKTKSFISRGFLFIGDFLESALKF